MPFFVGKTYGRLSTATTPTSQVKKSNFDDFFQKDDPFLDDPFDYKDNFPSRDIDVKLTKKKERKAEVREKELATSKSKGSRNIVDVSKTDTGRLKTVAPRTYSRKKVEQKVINKMTKLESSQGVKEHVGSSKPVLSKNTDENSRNNTNTIKPIVVRTYSRKRIEHQTNCIEEKVGSEKKQKFNDLVKSKDDSYVGLFDKSSSEQLLDFKEQKLATGTSIIDKDNSVAQDLFVEDILNEPVSLPSSQNSGSSQGSDEASSQGSSSDESKKKSRRLAQYNPFRKGTHTGDDDEFVKPTRSVLGSPRKVAPQPSRPLLKKSFSDTSALSMRRRFRVRNVKDALECQEIGETQEFEDDLDYILSGLRASVSFQTRCLSALSLASRCTETAFRTFLRSRAALPEIFDIVSDATANPSFAVTVATIMYMLSRDRLKIDFDASSLKLLLNLMNYEDNSDCKDPAHNKLKQKIRELIETGNSSSSVTVKEISPSCLAIETLLSITSQKAGGWFKEELRKLGGLEMLCATVSHNCDRLQRVRVFYPHDFELMAHTTRCLQLLSRDYVTVSNEDNEEALRQFRNGELVSACCHLVNKCNSMLVKRVDGFEDILVNCLTSAMRVLQTVSHRSEQGALMIGSNRSTVETCLSCALIRAKEINAKYEMDFSLISLGLLINLVEHCPQNRSMFQSIELKIDGRTIPAIDGLLALFEERYQLAKSIELEQELGPSSQQSVASNDSGLEPDGSQGSTGGSGDFLELVKAAGTHMEGSLVAAHVALFVGCFIEKNLDRRKLVLGILPDHSFDTMLDCLGKFLCVVKMSKFGEEKGVIKVIDILRDREV